MVMELTELKKAERLFGDWPETMIWSCLQGIMGKIYVDSLEMPQSAVAVLGDFYFFAGKPDQELVLYQPEDGNPAFRLLVPQAEAWSRLIQDCYGSKVSRITRYAIKKEPDGFSVPALQSAVRSLKPEYELRLIDEALYFTCREQEWSRDLVSQFVDYGMYQRLGIGVAVLHGGTVVSGASSYTRYREGIEIEIDTKEEFRGNGLAYASGARLILECLERGLYPSWDAHDKRSVALAEKLGYHLDREYTAFEVQGDGAIAALRDA